MANWNLPTITSGYLDFVTQMNDKFVDAATLLAGAPTNLPNASIRYNRTTNIFEEWDLTTWNPKVIGLLGGGTGSNTAAGARTNLGLGSMATQNSNAVNITGGSITGINFDAGSITTGIVALARGGTGASLSLGSSGYVLLSNGTQVVFDSGASISNLNANALTTGTVPDARLSANVAFRNQGNTFVGGQIFGGPGEQLSPTISTTVPMLNFYYAGGVVNQKYMRIVAYNGSFVVATVNDSYSAQIMYLFNANTVGFTVGDGVTQVLYANGSGVNNINAANIATGIINPARLGSGAANSGTFLRGDNVWAPATGGSGAVFPSGMISMFDVACPAGWTRYAQLDNRFPLGSPSPGATGGASAHSHHLNLWTDSRGSHGHSVDISTSIQTSAADNNYTGVTPGGGTDASRQAHTHTANVRMTGSTAGVGDHNHNTDGYTDNVDQYPPWYSVVYCRKD